MLGLLTSDFGYQNRLTLLQQLIECGDVLLERELVCDYEIFGLLRSLHAALATDYQLKNFSRQKLHCFMLRFLVQTG
ncbi:unnamed protein product [Chilo suppressalis]|uniref:Uncharacterized protein n=1 Tax=Chilo suppressalis TaxID=168631 RepID=A0ABN8ASX4_CHISP|nr:unnamed protein product [Chilo suppressalis]